MYYKVYIDSLFLINFTMNLYVMLLTKQKLHCDGSMLRILLGALIGAFSTCMSIVMPCSIILVIVGTVVMVKVAFPIEGVKGGMRILFTMLAYTFLFGGCLLFLFHSIQVLEENMLSIWGIMGLGGVIYTIILHYLKHEKKIKNTYCQVILENLNHKIKIQALLDSGNSLVEPISKMPVSIIEQEILDQLLTKEEQQYYRVVPYHSIGKEQGYLKAYTIDEIVIIRNGIKKILKHSYIGVSDTNLSTQANYQMILHPNLIEG